MFGWGCPFSLGNTTAGCTAAFHTELMKPAEARGWVMFFSSFREGKPEKTDLGKNLKWSFSGIVLECWFAWELKSWWGNNRFLFDSRCRPIPIRDVPLDSGVEHALEGYLSEGSQTWVCLRCFLMFPLYRLSLLGWFFFRWLKQIQLKVHKIPKVEINDWDIGHSVSASQLTAAMSQSRCCQKKAMQNEQDFITAQQGFVGCNVGSSISRYWNQDFKSMNFKSMNFCWFYPHPRPAAVPVDVRRTSSNICSACCAAKRWELIHWFPPRGQLQLNVCCSPPQTIYVWCIYLHLGHFWRKCLKIYHTGLSLVYWANGSCDTCFHWSDKQRFIRLV